MKKPRFAWTNEAIDLAGQIVHLQDLQIGSLGLLLKIVNDNDFDNKDFFKYLRLLDYLTRQIETTARQLYELREGKPGRPTNWQNQADETIVMALRIRKLIRIVLKEQKGNNWTVIETRLRVCADEITKFQLAIIKSLPAATKPETYISQRSAVELLELVRTLEMSEGGGGGRYRRK